MTASKRFAKAVAKCRANFEKNSELVARKTKRRRWDPRTPGMNHPFNLKTSEPTNYFKILAVASTDWGCHCYDVNPDNAQKLRWCGLVKTYHCELDEYPQYIATKLGEEYIAAARAYFGTMSNDIEDFFKRVIDNEDIFVHDTIRY